MSLKEFWGELCEEWASFDVPQRWALALFVLLILCLAFVPLLAAAPVIEPYADLEFIEADAPKSCQAKMEAALQAMDSLQPSAVFIQAIDVARELLRTGEISSTLDQDIERYARVFAEAEAKWAAGRECWQK